MVRVYSNSSSSNRQTGRASLKDAGGVTDALSLEDEFYDPVNNL